MRKAAWLRANPATTVTIEGHADERGTNEYNLAWGTDVQTVPKHFLVDLGIAASRLTTISYGEERPLCTAAKRGVLGQKQTGPLCRKLGLLVSE